MTDLIVRLASRLPSLDSAALKQLADRIVGQLAGGESAEMAFVCKEAPPRNEVIPAILTTHRLILVRDITRDGEQFSLASLPFGEIGTFAYHRRLQGASPSIVLRLRAAERTLSLFFETSDEAEEAHRAIAERVLLTAKERRQ